MKDYKYVARILFVTGDTEEIICDTEDIAYNVCRRYVDRYQDMVEYTHVRRIEK